ncbi:uncharacterized protein [Fopius arisanus]|uniref:Ube4b_1 protein n=1 Tax=Fopius arisanus TaxID=64838 RepID=A0A0C9QWS5_9HYME|nr:PREDICTED: uncharacterized protein LOC105271507 [Fopius arisanus]
MDSIASTKQSNRSRFKRSQHKKIYHKSKKGSNSNDSHSHDKSSQQILFQLDRRFAEISDDDEPKSSKSFEELLNAPVSTSTFVFKSETKWTWDASQFSDYFSVDVNHLSKIFKCIPFNEYVSVEEKYFNKDELTLINSSAELSRKDYIKELESSLVSEQSTDPDKALNHKTIQSEQDIDAVENIEEDLDFLLSLKEPVRVLPVNISSGTSRVAEDVKGRRDVKPTKSIDLEKWLDSVLDD